MKEQQTRFTQVDLFGFFHWAYYYFTKYMHLAKHYSEYEKQIKISILHSIATTIKTYFLDGNTHLQTQVVEQIRVDAREKSVNVEDTMCELGIVTSHFKQ